MKSLKKIKKTISSLVIAGVLSSMLVIPAFAMPLPPSVSEGIAQTTVEWVSQITNNIWGLIGNMVNGFF